MTKVTPTAGKIDDTLAERGGRYGPWREQSRVTQNIKAAFTDTPNWVLLPPYLREALDQISNKIARILSGDFMYNDNLHDIVGYAKLAEDCLNQDIANGVEGPRLIDPDNPPLEWLIEKLAERGFEVAIPPPEDRTDEVRPPSFMRDPIRGAMANAPHQKLVEWMWVFKQLDSGHPVYFYISHNRQLARSKTEVLRMYGESRSLLADDLSNGMVEAYSTEQDLDLIDPAIRPRFLGALKGWRKGT